METEATMVAMLSSLSFAAGGWMWLLPLAAVLPVAIHWLTRRQLAEVWLPTLRWLAGGPVRTGQRWRRLEALLLLLVRATLLVLLVLALAQPRWTTGAAAPGRRVIVVLDRTASMQRFHDGAMLFNHARSAALKLVEALDPATDHAGVVLLDAAGAALLPALTTPVAVARELRNQRVSAETGSLANALAAARWLAGDEPAELHLFGDMQQVTWGEQMNWPGPLVVHALPAATDNLSLRLLPVRWQGGDHRAMEVAVEVHNHGNVQRRVVVQPAGDAVPEQQVLSIPAGAAATTTFRMRPPASGPWRVAMTLKQPGDALALDNDALAVLWPPPAQRWHIVSRGDPADPQSAAAAFTALLPDAALIAPDELPGLLDSSIGPGDGLILVEAGTLGRATCEALGRHLTPPRRGLLLLVLDSEAVVRSLTTHGSAALLGRLPVELRPGVAAAVGVSAESDWDDPVLRLFEGAARGALLRLIWPWRPIVNTAHGARTPLRCDDGAPLIAWRPATPQSGPAAVIAARLDAQPAGILRQPIIVPLLHELLGALADRSATAPELFPGDRVPLPDLEHADRLQLVDPAGRPVPTDAPAEHLGEYRWIDARGNTVASRVVTLDPRESSTATSVWTDAAATGGRSAGTTERRASLVRAVLFAAAILLALEWLVARGWGWRTGSFGPQMLRLGGAVLLLIALLKPVIAAKAASPVHPPLTVLLDRSASMAERDVSLDGQRVSRWDAARRWLTPARWRELADLTQPQLITFGAGSERADPAAVTAMQPTDQQTRLVDALARVVPDARSAPGGVLLLLSDGNDTSAPAPAPGPGIDPGPGPIDAAAVSALRSTRWRVCPVLLGRDDAQTLLPDVAVTAWPEQDWLRPGQSTTVHVAISAAGWSGPQPVQLRWQLNDAAPAGRDVMVDPGRTTMVRFPVTPAHDPARRQQLWTCRIEVTGPANELDQTNNHAVALVETSRQPVRTLVLDARPNAVTQGLLRALERMPGLITTAVVGLGSQRRLIRHLGAPANVEEIRLRDYELLIRKGDVTGMAESGTLPEFVAAGGAVLDVDAVPGSAPGGDDDAAWWGRQIEGVLGWSVLPPRSGWELRTDRLTTDVDQPVTVLLTRMAGAAEAAAPLTVTVASPDGSTREVALQRDSQVTFGDVWRATLTLHDPGLHGLTALAGGEPVQWAVSVVQRSAQRSAEGRHRQARPTVLRDLARQTGGVVLGPGDWQRLREQLRRTDVVTVSGAEAGVPAWLLLLLGLLLAVEWAWRRRRGER